MIPLSLDVPMKRLPWANWGLILATIWISLAVPYATSDPVGGTLSRDHLREKLSPLVLQRHSFAFCQLVTALFQHADLVHLIGNMLFLFVFGNAINAKVGHLVFLAAYLAIGVVVNLLWLAIGPGMACLGASGAIMGMCGMFLVLYPRNMVNVLWDDEWEIAWITRSWIAEIPGWIVVLLFMAFDLWGAVTNPNGGIGYISHLAGAALGILLAIALLKAEWLTPDRGEQTFLQWWAGEGPVEEDTRRRPRRRKKTPRVDAEQEA
jgi:membrane associated rhomboid family serine protease